MDDTQAAALLKCEVAVANKGCIVCPLVDDKFKETDVVVQVLRQLEPDILRRIKEHDAQVAYDKKCKQAELRLRVSPKTNHRNAKKSQRCKRFEKISTAASDI